MIQYIIKFALLIIIICVSNQGYTQEVGRTYTPYQIASGYQRSFGINEYRAVTNPALLSNLEDRTSLFFSGEKRYFTGLNGFTAGFSMPIDEKSGLSISLTDFGFDIWRENSLSIQSGRRLTDELSLGIQLSGRQLRLSEFGSTNRIGIGLGLLYTPDDVWSISAMVNRMSNPTDELISGSYILGLQHKLSDKVTMSVEASLDISTNANVLFYSYALRYQPAEPLLIILAIHTNAASPSVGLHWNLNKSMSITVAASRHRFLGSTGSFGLCYTL